MWKYFFIKFWKWKKTYWYFTKNLKIGRNEKLKTGKNELLEKQYKWLVSLQKENLILYKLQIINIDLEMINTMFNISEKINKSYFVLINNLKVYCSS